MGKRDELGPNMHLFPQRLYNVNTKSTSFAGPSAEVSKMGVKVKVDDGGIPAHEHAVADRNAVGRHEHGARKATVLAHLKDGARAAGG